MQRVTSDQNELRSRTRPEVWPTVRRAVRTLSQPRPAATAFLCALMLLACNVNERIGHRYVTFKHFYGHVFVLGVLLTLAFRASTLPRVLWRDAAKRLLRAFCWFVPFCLLIGVGPLVSNGLTYQAMATNFWGTDPFDSTSRRLGLPAIANVIGFEAHAYIYFWYAILFLGFASALRYLEDFELTGLEKISLLTSTIFAYALIAPGYSEVFVFLLGLVALKAKTTSTMKLLLATLMIATHETATPFVAVVLILQADRDDRAEWLVVFGLLFGIYVATYLFTWRNDALAALTRAIRPNATAEASSLTLAQMHPVGVIFAILVAYKLYWSVVALGLARSYSRAMAAMACAPIVLTIVGTDTSRLTQFGSLAFLSVAGLVLPTLSGRFRAYLATANLVVPSLYMGSNVVWLGSMVPFWGRGLYSLYFHATRWVGAGWGAQWP